VPLVEAGVIPGGENIRVSPHWFVFALIGVGAIFAGAWGWWGLPAALFVTGAVTVVVTWCSVAFGLWAVLRMAVVRARMGKRGRSDG
jgi:hypothetical protein